jgi:hypothetical protein
MLSAYPRRRKEGHDLSQRPISPPTDEQRRSKALAMAHDYATAFMHASHLAKLAGREGWSGRLREYVTDAAFVQAQLMCGARDIGWNARLAEGLGRFHSSAATAGKLCPSQAADASTFRESRLRQGQITVSILCQFDCQTLLFSAQCRLKSTKRPLPETLHG